MVKFAVIFDMDGVLIDSTEFIWKSFNEVIKPHGIQFEDADIRLYKGMSLRDQIIAWNKRFNLNLDHETVRQQASILQYELVHGREADQALSHLLTTLTQMQVPIAVGTGSVRNRTEELLSHYKLRTFFEVIATCEDVEHHKPAPDIFLKAAERLGVSPEKCIVIEDAGPGIEAARRANMKAIGFLTNHNDIEELANADLLVNSFSELTPEILERLIRE